MRLLRKRRSQTAEASLDASFLQKSTTVICDVWADQFFRKNNRRLLILCCSASHVKPPQMLQIDNRRGRLRKGDFWRNRPHEGYRTDRVTERIEEGGIAIKDS
jgi:hypothetical protein